MRVRVLRQVVLALGALVVAACVAPPLAAQSTTCTLPVDDRVLLFTSDEGAFGSGQTLWSLAQDQTAPSSVGSIFQTTNQNVRIDAISDGDDWVPGRPGVQPPLTDVTILFTVASSQPPPAGSGSSPNVGAEGTAVHETSADELRGTVFRADFFQQVQQTTQQNDTLVVPVGPRCPVLGDPQLSRYELAVSLPTRLGSFTVADECWHRLYFSISEPATVSGIAAGPADILCFSRGTGDVSVYRTAAQLGLAPDDDIDALAAFIPRPGFEPVIYYSLADATGADGARVFRVGAVEPFYEPGDLGLVTLDPVDPNPIFAAEIITMEGIDPGRCRLFNAGGRALPKEIEIALEALCPLDRVAIVRDGVLRGSARGSLPVFREALPADFFLDEGAVHRYTIFAAGGPQVSRPASVLIDFAPAGLIADADAVAEISAAPLDKLGRVPIRFRAVSTGDGPFFDTLAVYRDGLRIETVDAPKAGVELTFLDDGRGHPLAVDERRLPPGHYVYSVVGLRRDSGTRVLEPAPMRSDGRDTVTYTIRESDTAPPPVAGLVVVPSDRGFELRWEAESEAERVAVLRRDAGGTLTLLPPTRERPFVDVDAGGIDYREYQVYNFTGAGGFSARAGAIGFDLDTSPAPTGCNCDRRREVEPGVPGLRGGGAGVPGSPCINAFIRGDCNHDGVVIGDPSDAVFLLDWVFNGGPAPPCEAACDANADGMVSAVSDASYLFNWLFQGGPEVEPPFHVCGVGTEADEAIGCDEPTEVCQ